MANSSVGILILALMAPAVLAAAGDRIAGAVDPNRVVALTGSVHPNAQPRYDQGAVDPAFAISYASLMLKPDASLEAFLNSQQTPSAPDYRRWLTPEEFADRFGLSNSDIAKIVAWLQSQGLTVESVARGRHWITFSGSAGQFGRALHTEIHHYLLNGVNHFANATNPSIPEALQDVVSGIRGLNDFGLQSMLQPALVPAQGLGSNYNSGSNRYLAPDDLATMFDIFPLYHAGIDGTGQKLAIIGQTDVKIADLRNFRAQFNLPAKDPQMVLFGPDPGTTGDLLEADLDLEWSAAVARNATILYVYSRAVDTAAQYAIDQNLAPVMSMSYGACELFETEAFRAVAQQANAQGITWFVSSGDLGAAACDRSSPTPQATKGPTVSWPASFPEITAVGGTEFNDAGGTYWAATNNANGASALSYVPEVAWNDSVSSGKLLASGGGPSGMFAKPAWQTGPGVPNDNARDVPDLSLPASPYRYAYLVESNGVLTAVGGTSASSPALAGVAALLNQYLVSKGILNTPGLGNINPSLYRLAQTKVAGFHDITAGSNLVACEQSSPGCIDGLVGYNAGPGYDLATGLGSIDAYQLVTGWDSGSVSVTTLTATPVTVGLMDNVQLTASVTGAFGVTPTGVVSFVESDTPIGSVPLSSTGAVSTATLSVSGTTIANGNGIVTALYSGDGVYTSSAAPVTITIERPASGSFVVPSVTPNPVYEQAAATWPFTITLNEKAGVATTLTGFTISDGTPNPLALFKSTKIPAKGSLSLALTERSISPPANIVFTFAGADADGKTWSAQITVPFLGPAGAVLAPAMTLTTAAPIVMKDAKAPSSCQWSQPLTLQEQGGFLMELTALTAGGTSFSSQIQEIFGTNRLAPYGMLRGALCFSSSTATGMKNITITGSSVELGTVVTASINTQFASAASNPAAFSVSTPAIAIFTGSAPETRTAALDLSFVGSAPAWAVSLAPANRSGAWLTASPLSGTGSARLNIQASSAGLSPGAYNGVVSIQSSAAIPQVIDVPVTLVVGASATTVITGAQNAFSLQSSFAPGMVMSVYGSQLSPSALTSRVLPLPLTDGGVSATVNGIAAPLYFRSPGQLNLQVPYETGAGQAVLAVNNNGAIASYAFQIDVAAPGLFTSAIDAIRGGAASSAQQGQALLLYMTGEGDVTPFLATGATPVSGTPSSKLPQPRLPVVVTVGGVRATIAFAGVTPGVAGISQINFTVPANAPLGAQPVVVTVGGIASPAISLNVTGAGTK